MEDLEDNESGMDIEEPRKNKKIKKTKANSPQIKNFSIKVHNVLTESKFAEKRSSKLHWSDFLELLQAFNENEIYFK